MSASTALGQWSDYPVLIAPDPASGTVLEAAAQRLHEPTLRIGSGNVPGNGGEAALLVFPLPKLIDGHPIADAQLWFTLLTKTNGKYGPADLYGLGPHDSTASESDPYYEGEADTRPGCELIARDVITSQSPYGRQSISWQAGQSLAAYIQKLYDGGAKPGQFIYLRLSPRANTYRQDRGFDIVGVPPKAVPSSQPTFQSDTPVQSPTLVVITDSRTDFKRPSVDQLQIPLDDHPAVESDRFAASIGTVFRLNNTYAPGWYEKYLRSALLESGIRSVRDSDSGPDAIARIKDLNAHGVKVCLLIQPDKDNDIPEMVNRLVLPVVDCLYAVEGPNEPDGFWRIWKTKYKGKGWPQGVQLFQQDLYAAIKNHPDPRVRALTVLTPALAHPDAHASLLSTVPADMAALHPYQGGQLPDDQLMTKWLPAMKPCVGDKPIVVTETGWHNTLINDGQPGISEQAKARYMLRLYLDYFQAGVVRTFAYDMAADPWGSLRPDGTRKPELYAVENLIKVTSDPGDSHNTSPLKYGIGGETGGVRHLLLQKQDGRYLLVLWQNSFTYDTRTRTDLQTAPVHVTVSVDHPVASRLFDPLISAEALTEASAPTGSIAVEVPDHPVIIEMK